MNDEYQNIYGMVTWVSFILCYFFGLLMASGGIEYTTRDYVWYYQWWVNPNLLLPNLVYNILTPACFFLLALFLYKQSTGGGPIRVITGICSIVAGMLWISYFIMYSTAVDSLGVGISTYFWSGSIISFGLAFLLVGVIYLLNETGGLSRITGVTFLLVGLAAMVVGYIGGFTNIPWFMVYDFPLVTALAIIPCFLAIFSRLGDSESGGQASEGSTKSLDIHPQ